MRVWTWAFALLYSARNDVVDHGGKKRFKNHGGISSDAITFLGFNCLSVA